MTGAYEITEEYEAAKRKHRDNHNVSRYANGTYCEDCNLFFEKGSDEYLRCDGISSLLMVVHNLSIEHPKSKKLKDMRVELLDSMRKSLSIRTDGNWVIETEKLRDLEKRALRTVRKYGKDENSARIILSQ